MVGMEAEPEQQRKPSIWVTLIWVAVLILVGFYAANSHSFLASLLRAILRP